jgi:hypothetical protein
MLLITPVVAGANNYCLSFFEILDLIGLSRSRGLSLRAKCNGAQQSHW